MQCNNMPTDLAAAIGGTSGKGNRTDQYADYGFEIGGPIVKGRLWAWGSVGKTDVRILTLTRRPDRTILEELRASSSRGRSRRTCASASPTSSATRTSAGASASATRPDETTYNQTGPSSFYKGEVNYVVGNNLFLTGRGVALPDRVRVRPARRHGQRMSTSTTSGVWHGSSWNYLTDRPQQTAHG